MMAVFLLQRPPAGAKGQAIERREKLYSVAGLVAKLGLLFSEYAAHARSSSGAISVAVIEGILFLVILAVSARGS
jgi:hypothetical protein